MLPKDPKPYTEIYIWFDYEAEQDTGIHRPNLMQPIILKEQNFISKPTMNCVSG